MRSGHSTRNAFIIVIIVVLSLAVLWITGPIPSLIARVCAQSYVESMYGSAGMKFSQVYWDSNWDRYFVSFTDKTGSVYSFKMSEFIPSAVMYDPINPPG